MLGPLADLPRWLTFRVGRPSALAGLPRRQPTECSIAKAMEAIGTRSAMLIVREARYGTTRFDDFTSRGGINDTVAAARLKQTRS
ncbi:winged helix-turn-helix transcriptional regulator [Micromonospora polyrhachis]|uniref:DNA-binding HxlR family transcriptional regulator n=1 Tax=Micromonospora polyrhachis TaxID=1282883 RepID=A0A7W7WQ19_9ACTN|nr:hypothetical protein [Micromonospora polyrhachis]MBB4959836.1 DNA-binding HxlR family transcriptional regulator [Micromonospora polyrhachis]